MKMKKLLKNAVVYAVAASMLFATPLTASAGLIDAYKVTDGTNKDKENPEPTGTVSNTESQTSSLRDNDAHIIGVALDQDYITVEQGKNATLKATVVIDGDKELPADLVDKLNALIRWETSELQTVSIDADADDRSTVSLYARRGTKLGDEVEITASIGGDFKYTWTDEEGESHDVTTSTTPYAAKAKVYVKEYATSVTLTDPGDQLVNHTLDMKDYLKVESTTANDTITWSVEPSVKGSATITADGVVTFKKEDKAVVIWALSERGLGNSVTVGVTKGIGATKVVIYNDDDKDEEGNSKTFAGNKTTAEIADSTLNVSAVMLAKVDTKDGKKELPQGADYEDKNGDPQKVVIDDVVTWTSNKSNIAIVEADDADGSSATITPLAVGTAKITAKTSSGKTAFVNVTVKAALGTLTITTAPTTLYSGQTLQMEYERNPEQNKDAVKWSIKQIPNPNREGKYIPNPNASINAKGVLTIKNKVDPAYPVEVVVSTTKAVATADGENKVVESQPVEIQVAQSSVDEITITDDKGTKIANSTAKKANTVKGKDNTTNISVPKDRTYTATVVNGDASTLTWKTSSAKIATVVDNGDGTASIKAEGKGTATITVSGINVANNKAKAIKTTFKVAVTQPVISLTMNKPSVVLKATGKPQNVALSVKPNKNAKASVTWSIDQTKGSGSDVQVDAKKGKVALAKNGYSAGDEFVVTATDVTGAKATSTIKVVTASTAVSINKTSTLTEGAVETWTYTNPKNNKPVKNAMQLEMGKSQTLYPFINLGTTKKPNWVAAGEETAAGVTYTVNKKGIVTIEGNTVRRVKAGSVTVTVKTEDGKSYKLKID